MKLRPLFRPGALSGNGVSSRPWRLRRARAPPVLPAYGADVLAAAGALDDDDAAADDDDDDDDDDAAEGGSPRGGGASGARGGANNATPRDAEWE